MATIEGVVETLKYSVIHCFVFLFVIKYEDIFSILHTVLCILGIDVCAFQTGLILLIVSQVK